MCRRRLRLAAAAGLCLAFAAESGGPALGQGNVAASGGGVAAGRDIVNSPITTIINQQDPAALAAMAKVFADETRASAEAKAQAEARAADLARQFGIATEAVEQFFRDLGERQVPSEQLPRKLAEIAAQYQEARAQLAALDPEDPATRDLVARAEGKLAAGRLAEATRLLEQAKRAEIAAAERAERMAERAQAAAERRRIRAAARRARSP